MKTTTPRFSANQELSASTLNAYALVLGDENGVTDQLGGDEAVGQLCRHTHSRTVSSHHIMCCRPVSFSSLEAFMFSTVLLLIVEVRFCICIVRSTPTALVV